MSYCVRKNCWVSILICMICFDVLLFYSLRVEVNKLLYFWYNVFVFDKVYVNSILIIIF